MKAIEGYRPYFRFPPTERRSGYIQFTNSFENQIFWSRNLEWERRPTCGRIRKTRPYCSFYAPKKMLDELEIFLQEAGCQKEN
jgi:hypothetical protein